MSTVNIGASLPAGSANIGNVKLVDTGGTNQLGIDANNNASVTIRQAANAMAVDSSNNAHVALYSGASAIGVKAANTPPVLADVAMVTTLSPNNTGLPVNIPTIIQSTNNKSSGSVASLAKAFVSNNGLGNSVIVVCAVGNGTAPTISDTNSNTYTQAAQTANGTAFNVAIFFAVNIASGANTITVNNGGSTASITMEIYEVSGLIAQVQAQPDQTASGTGTSGTAAASTVSAFSPNEFAFAGIGVGTAAQTITVGSGWTNDSGQQNPTTPAGLFSFVSMSQFLGSLKVITPQATFTSEPWAIVAALFKTVAVSIGGTVAVVTASALSTLNSTTATLTANSVFTGTSELSLNYSAISIEIFVDQASAASGLSVQQSQNGTNWDVVDTFSISASTAFNTTVNLIGDYFRIVYTNGTTNQGAFRLQTVKQPIDIVLPRTLTALGNLKTATQEALPTGANTIGAVTQASGPWTTTPNAATSGGSTPSHTMSAASTNATSLKGSAGQVYGLSISNANAAARYFKLYNKASAPTVGTDTPVTTIQIPANGTVIRAYPVGLALSTGIAWAVTTGITNADTGAVGANDLSIDIDYL